MFKKQFLITEIFPIHCNTAFQSHQNIETKLSPLWRFFLSQDYELNPIPIHGKKVPLNSKVKTSHLLISTELTPFSLQFKPLCLSKRSRFCFIELRDCNATYMFYFCIKGISAAAGSASEVFHYLFAGFSLPRTTFSTAR